VRRRDFATKNRRRNAEVIRRPPFPRGWCSEALLRLAVYKPPAQQNREGGRRPILLPAPHSLAGLSYLLPAAHSLAGLSYLLPAPHSLAGLSYLLAAAHSLAGLFYYHPPTRSPAYPTTSRPLARRPILLPAAPSLAGLSYYHQPPTRLLLCSARFLCGLLISLRECVCVLRLRIRSGWSRRCRYRPLSLDTRTRCRPSPRPWAIALRMIP
jgi:hypothetical protein